MQLMYKGLLVTVVFLVSLSTNALAKFGTNGTITTNFGGIYFLANSVAQQADGKILAAGSGVIGADYILGLARYNLDGSLDSSFGNSGLVTLTTTGSSDSWNSLCIQADGKIIVGGSMTSGGKRNFALTRYNPNGVLDTSFNNSGTTITALSTSDDIVYGILQQADKKIVAVGSSNNRFALARYNLNGSLDIGFGTNGIKIENIGSAGKASCVTQQVDGKLLVAGYNYNTNARFIIVRYMPDGTLDTTFNTVGYVTTIMSGGTEGVQSVIQQTDGKIVAIGRETPYLALTRYLSSGVADSSFGTSGKVTTTFENGAWGYGIIQQPDGKLVAAGYDTNGTRNNFILARYSVAGLLDTSFGSSGKVITAIGSYSLAYSVLQQSDGKLVLVGRTDTSSGFALARYTSEGVLDTQEDYPVLTGASPSSGLAGQMISLDLRGWNFGTVTGVQLRNSGGSVNASSLVATDTRITGQITLPVSPGLYDLYLATNVVNRTFKAVFTVNTSLAQPVQWQVVDLDKPGSPIAGPAGISIGDGEQDGTPKLYIAHSDTKIFVMKKNTLWTTWNLPAESAGSMQDAVLADIDLDGSSELYGTSSIPRGIQYTWSGSAWAGNSFCAYAGPLTRAGQAGGGLAELYSISGNNLMQTRLVNSCLINRTYAQAGGNILCSVAGDANNDLAQEVYFGCSDHKLYQVRYWGMAWNLTATVAVGTTDISSLAIGDLDRNGSNELYGSNTNGYIYQYTWSGSAWSSQTINSSALVVNKITTGDADNEGIDKLYAAGQDGHAYQFRWNGANWQMFDLGNAGSALIALTVGDGDANGQSELYAVAVNGHVVQFKAGAVPTPTPTATPTAGPTGTVTPTATQTPVATVVPTLTPTPTPFGLDRFLKIYRSKINPNRDEKAQVRWAQPQTAPVTITVYDMVGNKIITLVDHQTYPAGQFNNVEWNGHNEGGGTVGSGIYIVHIKTDGYETYSKVAIIK